MRFFAEKNNAIIVLEPCEEERAVLRAIIKASFDLALPVGLSIVDYHPLASLSDVDADGLIGCIQKTRDGSVIDIDFVQGRQCKTALLKEAPGRFRLNTRYFERYRGSYIPMLQRAQELLSHRSAITSDTRSDDCPVEIAVASAK